MSDNRSGRPRKVQGKGILDRPEVMQLKYELFWKVSLVPPHDPTDTDIGKPKFMPPKMLVSIILQWQEKNLRSVDRDNTGKFEVPNQFGLSTSNIFKLKVTSR